MKVLVCGGRDFHDYEKVVWELNRLTTQPDTIITGAAPGADRLAEVWATVNNVSVWRFKANWEIEGKAAGPIRNQTMIDVARPDLVVAFPGGRGTGDMVRRSRKAGIPVSIVDYPSDT